MPGPLWPYLAFFGFALMGGWDLMFHLVNRWRRRRVARVGADHTRRGGDATGLYLPLSAELEDLERQIDHDMERVS